MEDPLQASLVSEASLRYEEIGVCRLPARLENVSKAAYRLKNFCRKRGIDELVWPQIELAFCEAVNNAIEHGCGENPDLEVRIRWKWIDTRIEISVEDPRPFEALEFDVELPENPLEESGRGCFIIGSIMDSVRTEKCDYGHRLVMSKQVHPENCVLDRLQGLFETAQSATLELNASYTRLATFEGLAKDLADHENIQSTIRKGIERIQSLDRILSASIWTYHDGQLDLEYYKSDVIDWPERRTHSIESDISIANLYSDTGFRVIENCALLPISDPLYHENGCSAAIRIVKHQDEKIGVLVIQAPLDSANSLKSNLSNPLKIFAQLLGIAYASDRAVKAREEQERATTELEIASEIQKSLLPSSFPSNGNCRVIGKCVTALAVGGDYVDAIDIKGVGTLLVIADVMGKGVPAALLATVFRTAIRSRLNLAGTPGWLLSQINKQFHHELGHLNMFITAQAVFYSYEKKKLKLASAGHCPALRIKPGSGKVEELFADGIPLGISKNDIYEEMLFDLERGDRIVFFTDGIYEAENKEGKMLGIGALAREVPRIANADFEHIPDAVFDLVDRFSQGASATDDKTVLAIEIL